MMRPSAPPSLSPLAVPLAYHAGGRAGGLPWASRLAAAVAAAGALAMVALPSHAQVAPGTVGLQGAGRPLPPEEQLKAIRQALLDKALGSQTRVSSTAWVNERGELMEASQFRSNMEVRGVRVLTYTGQEPPQAVVAVEESRGPGATDAAACRDTSGFDTWRHPLALRMALHPAQAQALTGPARQASAQLASALQRAAQAQGGSLLPVAAVAGVPGATGAPGTAGLGNAYEQAVHGTPQPRIGLTVSVRTRLLGEAEAVSGLQANWLKARAWALGGADEESPARMRVEVLLERAGEAPVLSVQREVAVTVSARERPLRSLAPRSAGAIAEQATVIWMAVQDALACEPLVFEARRLPDGRFQLLAGADAGLRVGDRIVLTDGRHVPRRLLEAESAPHLALLEVDRVTAGRAEARQVAGPATTADPAAQWLAMPFGSHAVAAPKAAAAQGTDAPRWAAGPAVPLGAVPSAGAMR